MDGDTVYVYLFGDENSKWAETEEGYTLVQDKNDKWCYAERTADGYLTASTFALQRRCNKESSELTAFLRKTGKHLRANRKIQQSPKRERRKQVVGQYKILVVLVEFQDVKFSKTIEDFDRLFNQEDYHEEGAKGSVRDFFLSSSYGQLRLECDIYGPYTTSNNMDYYGGNGISGKDTNTYDFFIETVNQVTKDVDLSEYDGNHDGYVDNIHIIYAGYGEESGALASAIWAHESTFHQPYVIQGIKIDHYSCSPELRGNSGMGISRIGPHCHEIGHALGAMDYYDTDYSTNGSFIGTGKWDVMSSGNWNNDGITPADFNPYVKAYNFGWTTPKLLPEGEVTIKPSIQDKDNYYILQPTYSDDFYLVENRDKELWGSALPGAGLLLYHVHADIENAKNKINSRAPQKCYVVCASSSVKKPNDKPASYGDINSAGCPYPGSSGNRQFTKNTTPAAFYWSGKECGISLNEITLLKNGNITLVNNSSGIEYTNISTNSLYFEDFEDVESFNIVESYNAVWSVVKNPQKSSGIVSRPLAYSGDYCLQLSAANYVFGDVSSTMSFECSSETITENVILNGYFTSYGLTAGLENTLSIGYLTDANEWEYTEVSVSSNNWTPFSVSIPCSPLMKMKIKGSVTAGSILAIDNIEIKQKNSTNIKCHHVQDVVSDEIYSINGCQIPSLVKGLNIIRLSNGTIRKFLYLPR